MNRVRLKEVNSLKYLGAKAGRSTRDICIRIVRALVAMAGLDRCNIMFTMKYNLYKSCLLPVLLFRCEMWNQWLCTKHGHCTHRIPQLIEYHNSPNWQQSGGMSWSDLAMLPSMTLCWRLFFKDTLDWDQCSNGQRKYLTGLQTWSELVSHAGHTDHQSRQAWVVGLSAAASVHLLSHIDWYQSRDKWMTNVQIKWPAFIVFQDACWVIIHHLGEIIQKQIFDLCIALHHSCRHECQSFDINCNNGNQCNPQPTTLFCWEPDLQLGCSRQSWDWYNRHHSVCQRQRWLCEAFTFLLKSYSLFLYMHVFYFQFFKIGIGIVCCWPSQFTHTLLLHDGENNEMERLH